ncbi:MAG: PQQ-dependent sugar dehydrogenase [Myxococcota bacterium]
MSFPVQTLGYDRRLLTSLALLVAAASGLQCDDSSADDESFSGSETDDNSGQTPDTEPVMSGSPTLTFMVGGNGQSAPVDTEVAEPLQMRVTDNDQVPVAGVDVTFSVDMGGGELTNPVQQTDAAGIAALEGWVLGPTPGMNRVVGEVAGLAPITFEATGLADERGSFTIAAGDRQNGRVSQALAIAPEVLLLDGDGEPVEGQVVVFEVRAGGGEVEGGESMTDSEGRAGIDAWILGESLGSQELTARTEGLPDLVFQATAVSDEEPTLQTTSLIEITNAWDMDFLPNGRLLVSSKSGEIVAVDVDVNPVTSETLLSRPDDLDDRSQSGMLGLAVDPEFETNRYVYVFMSSNRDGDVDNRVRRFVLSEGGQSLSEDRDILTGISWSNGAHSGGRIEFGPSGFLWIGTGDNRQATVPQNVDVMGGKILRITRDGDPAPGNVDQGGRPEIFFRGVRNVQGLAFRRGDDVPFTCEHGPNENDEVTFLVNGGDGGWDPNDGEGGYNGYTGAVMSPPGSVQPAFATEESMGMCDCTFVYGNEWLAYDGALVVGFLGARYALAMRPTVDGAGISETPTRVLDDDERLRAMLQGPDGALYVIAGSALWRVEPQ